MLLARLSFFLRLMLGSERSSQIALVKGTQQKAGVFVDNNQGSSSRTERFQGNDRVLYGIILGVLTFWLFAQTTLNIAPDMGRDLGLGASTMNTAVSLTALFSGIFIVVIGGLADRVGRVRIVRIGFYLSILGSLLVGLAPAGRWASSFLLTGRALQGLSGACVMPASLALLKSYWEGAARQRAVSLWSIGSWGGSGVCALFGGLVAQSLGWRNHGGRGDPLHHVDDPCGQETRTPR
jgi:DHA2 family multidrug resistance protein-like MFS transporter